MRGEINWEAAQVACFNGKTRTRKKLELYFKQFKNKREKFLCIDLEKTFNVKKENKKVNVNESVKLRKK